jgi:hypothetical protein
MQSQPWPSYCPAIFFRLVDAVPKRNVVAVGKLHELLDGHLTKFGGTPRRDIVFVVEPNISTRPFPLIGCLCQILPPRPAQLESQR